MRKSISRGPGWMGTLRGVFGNKPETVHTQGRSTEQQPLYMGLFILSLKAEAN